MILKKIRIGLLVAVGCLAAGVFLHSAESESRPIQIASSPTGTNQLLSPGPDDGRIAFVAARMLEEGHYLRHSLDDEFSEKFFDRYIDTLDPQHIHFTEADLVEFDSYRTNLDDLTVGRRGMADTRPSCVIFERFLGRLQERTDYADSLLKAGKFEFNTDERIQLDRRHAAFPADEAAAKKLWLERLRFEVLQEKLALVAERKESASDKKGKKATAAESSKENPARSDEEIIAEKLTRRYNRNLRMFREFDHDDVLQIYLTALAQVYDPHSDYMNKPQADNFAIGMNLSLFGIGAELKSDDGYCVIQKLHPGPAAKSNKIHEGDKIIAVAQGDGPPVDVVEMQLNKAVQLIRGPKGSEVRLTIIPSGSTSERRVVSLVRDEIKLEDQAAKAKIIEFTNSAGKPLRLGVIDLPSFYANVGFAAGSGKPGPVSPTEDVARLIKKLEAENVAGIILDLRRNGGGSLEEVIRLTGLFIKEGPVVQVYGRDQGVLVDGDDDPAELYTGPLMVLTSRFSASASEILAGALQDYGRAIIVGDVSTHGKGTVQNVNQLSRWIKTSSPTNDPGVLKLTIRKFYRASGASTQLKGVLPDIVLPSVLNYSKDVGEASLDNPMPWDTIPGARLENYDLVAPYLSQLLRRSSERVATDQEFDYVREDIERFRKLQADKTISLNEKERLKEADENDARQKIRDAERLARKTTGLTVYEIKLTDVDKPGLPSPVGATNSVAGSNGDALAASDAKGATRGDKKHVDGNEEEKAPAVDANLDEAQRILGDYIELMSQKSPTIVNR